MTLNNKISAFDWVLTGLILHTIGGLFFNSTKSISYVLCGLGLVIIFYNVIFKMKYERPFNGIFRYIFHVYLLWSAFIIIRPFVSPEPFSADGYSLINKYTFLSLATPLIVFLSFRNLDLKSIFKFSCILGVIGIMLLVVNYRSIFSGNRNFDVEGDEYQTYVGIINAPLQFLAATSFLVLCFPFIPSKYRMIAYFSMFCVVFTSLYAARRSTLSMNLIILFSVFYLYIANSNKRSKFLKLTAVVVALLLAVIFIYNYSGSTFSLFLSRLDEDTRSGVEDYFFYSFRRQPLDWIVGRGINGTYYCPTIGSTNSVRGEIETGYLQMILKGGIIYLSLFVFALGQSAFLGFFRANNILAKAMAFYLIAHILFLIPFGLPAFDFEYAIVWICIFYCQSKEFRNCTNLEIAGYLNFTTKKQRKHESSLVC